MKNENPIINYYDEAIRYGFAIDEISFDRESYRIKCIKDFRQERYGHITQWKAGEYLELPLKTEYGKTMDKNRHSKYVKEMAADMFKSPPRKDLLDR
jgi:hypothetical protein